ncbi:MAG: serine hydrolase [Minicystis sp.]
MRSPLLAAALATLVSACTAAAPPSSSTPPPSTSSSASPARAPDPLAGLDAYVERSLATWSAPGLAIAIVHGDGAPVVRGYGVRELGKGGRVGADTVFPVASLTKTFTAAAAGLLVEEGKMGWDDPVVRHLPGFAMADARVTAEVTLRDLAAHRSGISEAADLLWFGTGYDRAAVLAGLRHVGQDAPFRSTFSYSNVLYLALGEAAARASGKSWDDLVRARLLDPIGMTRTRTGQRLLAGDADVARPHALRDGAVKPIDPRDPDNIAPAAALHASAADLARWLRVFLGRGKIEGRAVLPEKLVDQMLTPQMLVNLSRWQKDLYPESHFLAYGLGWMLQDYRGRLIAWNTGGFDGVSCSVAIAPEDRIGVVVLANVPWTGLPEAMVFRLLDAYLGAPEKDWSALRLDLSLKSRARTAAKRKELDGDRRDEKPPLPVEKYLGAYTSDLLGAATIDRQGDRLVLRMAAALRGTLEPWRGPVFRIHFDDPELGVALCTFEVGADGAVTGFALEDHGKFGRAKPGK